MAPGIYIRFWESEFFYSLVSHMKSEIAELESLRREYEKCGSSSSGLSEAIERGWAPNTDDNRDKVSANFQRAEAAKEQLLDKIKNFKRSRRDVVSTWIAIHIETCLHLLQSCINSDNPNSGVRIICLSDALQNSAKQLQPNGQPFTVNDHFLPDYRDVYDKIFSERYG